MIVPYKSDASADSESVQLDLIRKMPPSVRLQKALALSCEVIRMSKAAIRRRHPEFSEEEVGLMFIELTYGKELADAVRNWRSGVLS